MKPELKKAYNAAIVECELLEFVNDPKLVKLFLLGYQVCYKEFEEVAKELKKDGR